MKKYLNFIVMNLIFCLMFFYICRKFDLYSLIVIVRNYITFLIVIVLVSIY